MLLLSSYTIVLALAIISSNADETCEPIRTCPYAQINSELSSSSIPLNHGSEVAANGHITGVRPLNYSLYLRFQNETHYSGSVNITMFIVENTTQVSVSLSRRSLQFDWKNILIYRDCSRDKRDGVCISRVIYADSLKVFQLRLQSILLQNAIYVLSFPEFSSFVYNETTKKGAEGLRRIVDKSRTIIYTDLRMDKASTMYPCFDYPSLKAEFQLCIQHSQSMEVYIGNRQSYDEDYFVSNEMRFCYRSPISFATYVLGFALSSDYKNEEEMPNTRCNSLSDKKVDQAISIIERITNTMCPFRPLNVVTGRLNRTVGTDNAGFVMVDCDTLLDNKTAPIVFRHIYRSVVKQWIGVLATVDHFGLACLADSLIEYLVLLIEEELGDANLAKQIDQARQFLPNAYEPLTTTDYYFGKDSSELCYTTGVVIFNMLREHNVDLFQTFLVHLFASGTLGSTSMQDWNDALMFRAAEKARLSRNFFSSWFGVEGPVILFIRNDGYNVSIRQSTPDNSTVVEHPVAFPVYASSQEGPVNYSFNRSTESLIMYKKQDWFLIDPYDVTPTYKVYDSVTYYKLFHGFFLGQGNQLELLDPLKVLNAFCDVLYGDLLPQAGDKDVSKWKDVFKYVHYMSPDCRCCLSPAMERTDCGNNETEICDNLTLVRLLGYNKK